MSKLHQYDGMFSVRERPWEGVGVVLEDHPNSIEEAINLAGLNWKVEQREICAISEWDAGEDVEIESVVLPGYLANMRADNNQALGVVTDRYKPVQNSEAFSFLNSLFGSELHFETAGSLQGGKRVWVMMKIPDFVEVGGDPISQYAMVSNSHDGKSSVTVAVTPIRVPCQNMVIPALRGASRTYTIRHLGDPSKKLVEARHALNVTINYYEKFKVYGDGLALVKLTDKAAKRMIENLVPIDRDSMKERAIRNREETRDALMSLYKYGTMVEDGEWRVTTVPENAPDTAWAFYNAAAEYADWYRGEKKAGGRFQRSVDDPDGFKATAWEIALEAAGWEDS